MNDVVSNNWAIVWTTVCCMTIVSYNNIFTIIRIANLSFHLSHFDKNCQTNSFAQIIWNLSLALMIYICVQHTKEINAIDWWVSFVCHWIHWSIVRWQCMSLRYQLLVDTNFGIFNSQFDDCLQFLSLWKKTPNVSILQSIPCQIQNVVMVSQLFQHLPCYWYL